MLTGVVASNVVLEIVAVLAKNQDKPDHKTKYQSQRERNAQCFVSNKGFHRWPLFLGLDVAKQLERTSQQKSSELVGALSAAMLYGPFLE